MTAVLRLKQLNAFWQRRRRDGYVKVPIRILLLTFNRTLRAYVEELAQDELVGDPDCTVTTFGKWAQTALSRGSIKEPRDFLSSRADKSGFPPEFLVDEVDYVLGRFLPDDLDRYLDARREGRGSTPRMERTQRQRLLDDVVRPYLSWKRERGLFDWNDLAAELAVTKQVRPYHIVIVDEAQDFSGNQIRAIMNHVTEPHTITFILDTIQRIYPRGFASWRELGVTIPPGMSHRLSINYRNTKQIAAFAHALVSDLSPGDDGALPDLQACTRTGPLPRLLEGSFSAQMAQIVPEISQIVATSDDSVAILHPRGGGWFSTVKSALASHRLDYIDLTRVLDWPGGQERIALSTMHSAKGLEFDHVYIVGLNEQLTPIAADGEDETSEQNYRRLLAMSIGRARSSITISYKASEASKLIGFLEPSTYKREELQR